MKKLKLLLLVFALGCLSVRLECLPEFISIPRADLIIMKNLLNLQESELNKQSLLINTLRASLKEQQTLSMNLQQSLSGAMEQSTVLTSQLLKLQESTGELEKSFQNISKTNKLQKVLLIVIPIALAVLCIFSFGAGALIMYQVFAKGLIQI